MGTSMSVGLGIFLSSLFLGIIILFVGTKDRWNWKKIVLWPFVALVVVAMGIWIYNKIESSARVQTTFWDIPLGATKGDVKFLKGTPNDLSEGEDSWAYITYDSTGSLWEYVYRVQFRNGRVWIVSYDANSRMSFGQGIQGLDLGDTMENVVQKFGTPSHISSSEDELSRVVSFDNYQVFFSLAQNKVTGYGAYDSAVQKGVNRR